MKTILAAAILMVAGVAMAAPPGRVAVTARGQTIICNPTQAAGEYDGVFAPYRPDWMHFIITYKAGSIGVKLDGFANYGGTYAGPMNGGPYTVGIACDGNSLPVFWGNITLTELP